MMPRSYLALGHSRQHVSNHGELPARHDAQLTQDPPIFYLVDLRADRRVPLVQARHRVVGALPGQQDISRGQRVGDDGRDRNDELSSIGGRRLGVGYHHAGTILWVPPLGIKQISHEDNFAIPVQMERRGVRHQ